MSSWRDRMNRISGRTRFVGCRIGDVFWDEGAASDYFNELFTDSAQRYLSEPDLSSPATTDEFSLPVTRNLVVMLSVVYDGEVPELETNLADINAMKAGLFC